jgi:hypothetical protein
MKNFILILLTVAATHSTVIAQDFALFNMDTDIVKSNRGLFIGSSLDQAKDTTKQRFKFKKDQAELTKNIFILPRPNALAVGVSFKLKHDKLAIGPWAEYLRQKSNPNDISLQSFSLGFLANYTFAKKGAYGIGPTLLFICSVDNFKANSALGSEVKGNSVLGGLYAGFQYTSPIRLNIWLGFGILGILPFNTRENLSPLETPDAYDNFKFFQKNRLFPFPGIMIGYAL